MKKIISLVLVIALCCTISVGLTLAYLTDRDSEANVFTVGDVTIDLTEDFVQGETLIPGVVIEKEPTIVNTGKNDAWVFATVAVPQELAGVIKFDGRGADWAAWTGPKTEPIDGKNYSLYTVLYNKSLAKGDETTALFETVTLNETVDIDPNGQWYTVVDGTAADLGWNNSMGNPVVHVSAYAIQKNEFATVEEAYAAYMGQWGTNGTEYDTPANVTEVATADELVAAVTAGDIVVLTADVDLSGYDISNLPAGSGINVPNGTNVTIHGNGNTITVGHTAFNNNEGNEGINSGDLTFKDVVFKAATPMTRTATVASYTGYAVCTGFDYTGTVTFKNCTFDGLYTAIYMNQNASGTPSKLIIEDCKYLATKWGYGIDTYTSMQTGNMIPYYEQVNVTFTGNTGIADACVRENTWEADAPAVYLPADGDALQDAANDAGAGDVIVMPDDIDAVAETGGYSNAGITPAPGSVLDGNGNTLTVDNANGTWDCAVYTKGGTIKNLTVNGAFRGIFTAGFTSDVIIDNVIIDKVCYTFSADDGNKNYGAYISNSTLNGWTSYTDEFKEVVFTNCNFGKGTGGYTYAFCRPYNASVFTNCVFAEGYEFDTSKTSDLVFENCYYGDTLITAENAETLGIGETTFFYKGLNGATIK